MAYFHRFSSKLRTFSRISLLLAIFFFVLHLPLLAYQSSWGQGFYNPYRTLSFQVSDFFVFLSSLTFLFSGGRYQFEKTERQTLLGFSFVMLCVFLMTFFLGHSMPFFLYLAAKLCVYVLFLVHLFLEKDLKKHYLFFFFLSLLLSFFYLPEFFEQSRFAGAFVHPNVLGGFTAVFTGLYLLELKKLNSKKTYIVLFFALLLLFLSQSRVAVLALIPLCFALPKKKETFYALLAFLSLGFLVFFIRDPQFWLQDSFVERLDSYIAFFDLLLEHPLGIGFQNTTLEMIASEQFLKPWQHEPIHNVFMLFVLENGLPLFFLFLVFAGLLLRKRKDAWPLALSVVILMSFDHYFYSFDNGRMLFVFVLAFIVIHREKAAVSNDFLNRLKTL